MIRLRELNRWRDKTWERMFSPVEGADLAGCFVIPSDSNASNTLRCIAVSGGGWDHVSVSCTLPRCPSWQEMDQIKRLFFRSDEAAMQLHPPVSDHISIHPFTLHLWRPHDSAIPMPPKEYV